jgi:hypothetical protein
VIGFLIGVAIGLLVIPLYESRHDVRGNSAHLERGAGPEPATVVRVYSALREIWQEHAVKKKRRWALYETCDALQRLSGVWCCGSCFDDLGYGYELCEIESPDDVFVSRVCCLHAGLEPQDESARRAWWAILLREVRRKP